MREIIKSFLLLLFFEICVTPAIAGVGDTDNRYYVTDEMWAQDPYNKFVNLVPGWVYTGVILKPIDKTHFQEEEGERFRPFGNCSAQYISPNLILSAGHCIFTETEFQDEVLNNPTISLTYKKNAHRAYKGKNYKKESFDMYLVDTEYTGVFKDTLGDWAVWLVTAPEYYSDAYFDVKIPTKNIDVINAGWGWARIFSDEELEKLRKIYNDLQIVKLKEDRNSSVTITDLQQQIATKFEASITDTPNKLKASECTIVFDDCAKRYRKDENNLTTTMNNESLDTHTRYNALQELNALREKINEKCDGGALQKSKIFPEILATTCDSWAGNSGGGYISKNGKFLYGTCSYGVDGFENKSNTDYIVSSKQFDKRIKDLIKKYDSKNSVEENIAKIPTGLYGDTYEVSTERNDNNQRMLKRSNTFNIEGLEEELTKQLPNIPTMSNEQLLQFVDKLAEYEEKTKRLEELQKAYDEAKEREQSLANRTLTALTTAATGIGGMELAQGLSEQKADKEADANMDAYLETFACSYGEGKRVKAGPEEIELPGGNDAELMKLRSEYVALAADLKERKTALGMKPGIESEEILDKATMGLYDDESIGIDGGAYASLYRAKMLGSEEDQSKIDDERKSSKNRVIAGGVLVGAGVVGGIIGNSAINGKLAEKIKATKEKKKIKSASVLDLKQEVSTLSDADKQKIAEMLGMGQ